MARAFVSHASVRARASTLMMSVRDITPAAMLSLSHHDERRTSIEAFGQVVETGSFAAAGERRDFSVGPKAPLQLESYGARLRDDEPRLPRDDPRGGHDIAVVGRSVEEILHEERRRPVARVQATAEIH